jgi:Ca-activated chloride channel family protein
MAKGPRESFRGERETPVSLRNSRFRPTSKRLPRSLTVSVVVLIASALLCAQQLRLKTDVLLINVVATVVDGKGRTVPNLTVDDFIIEEDGQRQSIKHFLPSADLPISIGVVLDVSGSMASKIRTAQRAIERFLSVIHKDDEVFLMTFSIRASVIADFTSDRTTLRNALLTGVNVSGGTALYDSLYQALQKVQEGRYDKRAILLVTDGEEVNSLTRFDKALQYIREAEMLVYSVGIKGAPVFDLGADLLSGTSASRARNHTTVDMAVLNQFGEASGGRAWEIAEAAFGRNMNAVLDTLAAELRSQYSVGYYPSRPKKDGKWHRVGIRMKNADYSVRGRKEYLDK